MAGGDRVTLALLQGVLNTFVLFVARIIGKTVDRAPFKTIGIHRAGRLVGKLRRCKPARHQVQPGEFFLEESHDARK
jgi:hypothetical protein